MNSQVVFQAEPGALLTQKLEAATRQGRVGRNNALFSPRPNCSSSQQESQLLTFPPSAPP